jgi:hypothetical protein
MSLVSLLLLLLLLLHRLQHWMLMIAEEAASP